ncbi:MAG: alanine racemase [Bacteroidetes bacterium]|nr:alanine racemase [Bacteroidota bacterium]
MLLSDLPTPTLLIDRNRLEANIEAVQARADREGVALRTHIKTHKCPDLARLQKTAGAKGLTVATLPEAEAFAASGFDDLVIAKEVVDAISFGGIAKLMEQGVRMAFCVDTIAGAEAASAFYSERERTADVLVEVDVGHGRCGIGWEEPPAVDFVRHVGGLSGLHVRGLLTHAGHSYLGPSEGETRGDALDRVMAEERDRLLSLAARLGAAGLLDPSEAVLSLGSTPTFSRFENAEQDGFRITEARPGNYVFHDAIQVALGVCSLTDCALTVQATVISIHRGSGTDRVYVNAGKKTLTTDKGYGLADYGVVLHSPRTMKRMPHARLASLSEEHGWIEIPGGAPFDVGDRVRIVPNHACVAVATQSKLYVVDGDEVVGDWEVVAR